MEFDNARRVSMNLKGASRTRDLTIPERAKKEREARTTARERVQACVKIQSCIRMVRARALARRDARTSFTRKTHDLNMLAGLFKARGQAAYFPPAPALAALMREWLFGWHVPSLESEQRRVALLGFVSPAFAAPDRVICAFAARCLDDADDEDAYALVMHSASVQAHASMCAPAARLAGRTQRTGLLLRVVQAAVADSSTARAFKALASIPPQIPSERAAAVGASLAALAPPVRRVLFEAWLSTSPPPQADLVVSAFSYQPQDESASAFVALANKLEPTAAAMAVFAQPERVCNLLGSAASAADSVDVALLLAKWCDRFPKSTSPGALSPRASMLLGATRSTVGSPPRGR
jgi:hypothetical protein